MASTGIHNGLQPIGEKSRKVGWGVMICRAQAMLDGADDMLVGFRLPGFTTSSAVQPACHEARCYGLPLLSLFLEVLCVLVGFRPRGPACPVAIFVSCQEIHALKAA